MGARLALKNANMSPLPHGLGPVRLDWQVGLRKRPSLTQMAIMKPIRDVRQGGGGSGRHLARPSGSLMWNPSRMRRMAVRSQSDMKLPSLPGGPEEYRRC